MSVSISLWRIAVDTPEYLATDLSGKGAEITGGRWNRKGHPVVYASRSVALACLETAVHLKQRGLPLNRYLVHVRVPLNVWNGRLTLDPSTLPVGWDALPEGKVSLDVGDQWLGSGSTPLLEVPSVVVPEEHNVLINPSHPLSKAITAEKIRKWHYDPRLRDPNQ